MTIVYHNADGATSSEATNTFPGESRSPAKPPLAIRKEIRDNWEATHPDLEARLSSILQCPWKVSIDTDFLYSLAGERYAKEDPGAMFREYISEAIDRISEFAQTYPDDGVTELNYLAFSRVVTLEPTSDPKIEYNDCSISDGKLRLLFSKGNLGVNVYRCAENLAGAVNAAGLLQPPAVGSSGELSFLAAQSVKHDYQPHIESLRVRIANVVAMPEIRLISNFAANFAMLAGYKSTNYDFPQDWQMRLGTSTLEYFEGLASFLEDAEFGEDELLKEGFREAVSEGEVAIRVVEKLIKGDFYECVVEEGVLYMQTVPRYWTSDSTYVARGLIDVL